MFLLEIRVIWKFRSVNNQYHKNSEYKYNNTRVIISVFTFFFTLINDYYFNTVDHYY